jgi:very-short-patch-repair endonuclease
MRDRRLVPYCVRLKRPARELRGNLTVAERKLWYEFLRYLPQKFTRQKPLGSYIADFSDLLKGLGLRVIRSIIRK